MHDLVDQLLAAIQRGRRVACCRLVETRGSTPQKAGAAMLVFADGSQAGTLGGGCVEAEVKRQALAILGEGRREIVRFQLDDDYGWDDGLICGGRMQVLDRSRCRRPRLNATTSHAFTRSRPSGDGCTEAIVFDAEASGLPAAASYLFDAAGRLIASLARTPLDDDTCAASRARQLAAARRAAAAYAAHGIAYLPLLAALPAGDRRRRARRPGGGQSGGRARFRRLGRRRPRRSMSRRARFRAPSGGSPARSAEVLPALGDHAQHVLPDRDPRAQPRRRGAVPPGRSRGRYVGMIGSKRKIKLIFDDLLAEGMSPKRWIAVHAPLGLDIGSQTVPEIAVSIVAELVARIAIWESPAIILRERTAVPARGQFVALAISSYIRYFFTMQTFAIIPAAGRSVRDGATQAAVALGPDDDLRTRDRDLARSRVDRVILVVHPQDTQEWRWAAAGAHVVQPSIAPSEMKVSVQLALDHISEFRPALHRCLAACSGRHAGPGDASTIDKLVGAYESSLVAEPDAAPRIWAPRCGGRARTSRVVSLGNADAKWPNWVPTKESTRC